MTNTAPVKRNENLIIFSHEHHHGLLFAVRLRSAKKTSAATIQAYVKDFWNGHLSSHFTLEEKLLQKFLADKLILKQFLNEHEEIRELVRKIFKQKEEYISLASKLSKAINDHIRFEERIMFPFLEKALSEVNLKMVGKELSGVDIKKHEFEPEFWK